MAEQRRRHVAADVRAAQRQLPEARQVLQQVAEVAAATLDLQLQPGQLLQACERLLHVWVHHRAVCVQPAQAGEAGQAVRDRGLYGAGNASEGQRCEAREASGPVVHLGRQGWRIVDVEPQVLQGAGQLGRCCCQRGCAGGERAVGHVQGAEASEAEVLVTQAVPAVVQAQVPELQQGLGIVAGVAGGSAADVAVVGAAVAVCVIVIAAADAGACEVVVKGVHAAAVAAGAGRSGLAGVAGAGALC